MGISFDIQKNFDLRGKINNKSNNGDNVKTFVGVINFVTKKRAQFWIDSDNTLHTEPEKFNYGKGIIDDLYACLMWSQDLLNIAENYKKSEEVEMEEKEKKMGDIKYTYADKMKNTDFNYFLKGNNLTVITEVLPYVPSFYATLDFEIKDAKIMKESELTKIPEGLKWKDY